MDPRRTKQNIEELAGLRSRIRNWRLTVSIVTGIVALVSVLILRNSAQNLLQKGPAQDEFVAELKGGLTREVIPEVKEIATDTLRDLMPVIEEEFKNLKVYTPELVDDLRNELQTLRKNLPERAERVLNRTFGEVIRERESQILQMYPEVTEETVNLAADRLIKEGQERVGSIVATITVPYQESLDNIVSHIETIRNAETGSLTDQAVIWDTNRMFFDVIKEELDQLRPLEYQ